MIQTTYHVDVDDIHEYPSMAVMQTNFIATDIVINLPEDFRDILTTSTATGSHEYFVALFLAALFLAEIDPRVNASGQRVFDVTVNGDMFVEGMDIYDQTLGPTHWVRTRDNIKIEAKIRSNSLYPVSIAGAEVLQLFHNPMNLLVYFF